MGLSFNGQNIQNEVYDIKDASYDRKEYNKILNIIERGILYILIHAYSKKRYYWKRFLTIMVNYF